MTRMGKIVGDIKLVPDEGWDLPNDMSQSEDSNDCSYKNDNQCEHPGVLAHGTPMCSWDGCPRIASWRRRKNYYRYKNSRR